MAQMRISMTLPMAGALAAGALALAGLVGCAPSQGRYIDDGYFADTDLTRQNDIQYGAAPALPDQSMPTDGVEALYLDLVMPKLAVDPETARPAMVWIHGGGFKAGGKKAATNHAVEWASRGYVVVNIDYRLDQDNRCQDIQDGVTVPPTEIEQCRNAIIAAQHDAQAAVRWLRANAGQLDLDPTKIAVMGASAGAVTAVNVAYNAHDPGTSNDLPGPSSVGAAAALSGAAYPGIAEIGPGDAPVIYAHCTNDQAVDWDITEAGIDEAHAAGLVADALVWSPPDDCAPGEIHAVDLLITHEAEIDLAFAQFFYVHLQLT
jgi:dienelactone hydrolase